MSDIDTVRIGIVSISDRASTGVYEDKGLPALKDWLGRALRNPISFEARLIPDDQSTISAALIELVDAGCCLVLTTGGTGPALRDVTPEATLAISDMWGAQWKPSPDGPIIALEVADFNAAIAALRAAGVKFNLEPIDSGVCRMAIISDPAGNAVTIHHRKPKS